MKIRTRFAPSPTGYLHIGGLRTALFTWLFTRKNEGTFILRIEDTDQNRLVEGAIDAIYRSLKFSGLNWDEGPDIGGEFGPYIQSERIDMYLPYAKELVDRGGAYYCFCTKERLDGLRTEYEKKGETFKYDKHCMSLSKEEIDARIAAGEPYVIRQNVPVKGIAGFDDAIYGHIEVDADSLDDTVLIKSDGFPTYNFANVVDDHTMGITHVIRGTEYLSSTPKYNLIYDSFGWEKPVYIHVPPVMADAKRKLSKRHGDPSFEDLLEMGYIKESIINYIALLGWNPGDDREIMTMQEMQEAFSLDGISKSPAIFDREKLTWFNAEYIRRLPVEDFHQRIRPYLAQVIDVNKFDTLLLAALLQPRCEVLPDVMEKIDFLAEMPIYDISIYTHKKMKTTAETSLPILEDLLPLIENIPDGECFGESMKEIASSYIEQKGCKNGLVLWPLRVAISGKMNTPGGAYEIAQLLGKEETVRRMHASINLLKRELYQ